MYSITSMLYTVAYLQKWLFLSWESGKNVGLLWLHFSVLGWTFKNIWKPLDFCWFLCIIFSEKSINCRKPNLMFQTKGKFSHFQHFLNLLVVLQFPASPSALCPCNNRSKSSCQSSWKAAHSRALRRPVTMQTPYSSKVAAIFSTWLTGTNKGASSSLDITGKKASPLLGPRP